MTEHVTLASLNRLL